MRKPLFWTVLLAVAVPLLLPAGCSPRHRPDALEAFTKGQLARWNKDLTGVLIDDIFTPPVCSRIYAYANIAAYEALQPFGDGYRPLAGQLNDLADLPRPSPGKTYYPPLASAVAFAAVGQQLVFNQDAVQALKDTYLAGIKSAGIDRETYENSLEYGHAVAAAVLAWASSDGYRERQTLPRYLLSNSPGKWQPTPPDYMQGIEPHWATLRPFVLDSARQFVPPPPTPFDSLQTSRFYKEALEVYEAVNQLDDEKTAIAKFWDCNPNISYTKGHVMFYHQKISPGGHWVSITGIANGLADANHIEEATVTALVSIALADAFISCWDEKYRSSLIRPQTYINSYIDPDWRPLLQTPAFPEHTSGHSVVSAAAATVLTGFYGKEFPFTDTSEEDFGLPARDYTGFLQASDEAAISRLYGGIHFRPAIEHGVAQGKKVGRLLLERVSFRSAQLARRTAQQ